MTTVEGAPAQYESLTYGEILDRYNVVLAMDTGRPPVSEAEVYVRQAAAIRAANLLSQAVTYAPAA